MLDDSITLRLLPIAQSMEGNLHFAGNPDCVETLQMSVDYFTKIGYNPPWIGYYAEKNGQIVGAGAFKGQPVLGKVEIAYSTFEKFRGKGIGTQICHALVQLALAFDPSVIITARTLPERNHSTRILENNGFILLGTVPDPEDGPVFEWLLKC